MRSKFPLILLLCISLFLPLNVSAAASLTPVLQEAEFIAGEVIVIMKPGKTMSALSLPEKARASTKKRPGLAKLNAGVIQVPPGEEAAYIARLKKQGNVLAAEPNYLVTADLIPNDTDYPLQYGPALIQAESAWDITTGSSSVTLAVIDSGLDAAHPEFAGRITAGYDYIDDEPLPDGDPDPDDECGHGTHVAGIAAAAGNNAAGIAGIAWNVRLMPLRILNRNCGGSSVDLAEALVWAADHGAEVVNLSVGIGSSSTLLENAAYYAYSHGTAIFAAAGNSGINAIAYPARYDSVMAVGATNQTNTRAGFSSYGATLDIMAPGDAIYSTTPALPGFRYNESCLTSPYPCNIPAQYGTLSGTSMASPHAAGAAALLASLPCFDTPAKIYQALTTTALDLGGADWDQYYGYGLIQVTDALSECPTITPPSFTVEYDLVTTKNCSTLVQYNWRHTGGGTNYFLPSGNSYVSIPLPAAFDFQFGGQGVTSPINGHANGFISMGNFNTESTEGNFRENSPLPGAARPGNFIAPFWDDLSFSGSGVLSTQTIGSAPNREFVIEYLAFQRYSVPGLLNFQVVLFETTDEILIQYRTLTGEGADGSSATVGLEYGDVSSGFAGYEYSHNQPDALEEGLALLFIPYPSGSPTLPSHVVCPQMKAVTIESGRASTCDTSPATFDVDIAAGELAGNAVLKVQQMAIAPAMPSSYLDLSHYADINLDYSPPALPLPAPEVDVCYEYTSEDLLAAGGHPENLFITAHNTTVNQWQKLPTTVDTLNSRLLARAPHFSYYGVATLNPSAGTEGSSHNQLEGLGLPVTGGVFSPELGIFLSFISLVVLGGAWLRRRPR